jgi:hypothetical protein
VPTSRPRENPYQPGDIVSMAHFNNGVGEGVLWRVKKADKVWIWVEPVWAVTGPSVLRDKRIQWQEADAINLVQLASAFAQLGNIIADIARSRGMEGDVREVAAGSG